MTETKTIKNIPIALPLLLLLLFTLILTGCKEDPLPDPVFYTIRADKSVLIADGADIITLKAIDRYNEEITDDCLFFVNGTALPDNTYSTTVVGTVIFSAEYKNVVSNNLVIPARKKYSFTIDKTTILADGIDRAVISVTDYKEDNKTDQTEFYIDGQLITGNAFSTTTTGVYTMEAKIDGYNFTSEVTTAASVKFDRRILIEDFTGAWCGYCPRMTNNIESAKATSKNILVMAIHNGDIMATPYEAAFRGIYKISAFPTALINRTLIWDERSSTLIQQFQSDIAVGVAINSSVAGTILNAEVNIRFNAVITDDIKLAAYIIEDNIISPQTNFYNDGRGNPIENFNHSAVLREKMTTDFMGVPVNTAEVTAGSVVPVNLSATIKPGWDIKECKILVLVVKASNDQVITCQEAYAGRSVGY